MVGSRGTSGCYHNPHAGLVPCQLKKMHGLKHSGVLKLADASISRIHILPIRYSTYILLGAVRSSCGTYLVEGTGPVQYELYGGDGRYQWAPSLTDVFDH